MLITPEGEWVLSGSSEFLGALGDSHPDYDAEAFAVKNLGFIKFTIIERTIVEIELHPRNVALPALLSAQQRMQAAGVALFRIKYLETTWQSEITSSAEQAITRLSQLAAPPFDTASRDRFIVEPYDYARLLGDETNDLRFMAQKWRMSFGQFDASLIPFAINHGLLAHMVIIGIKPLPTDPIFRFIGDEHSKWMGSHYHFNAIGERLENFPDKDYGAWVSQYYRSVAITGQPRYDHVTASIHRQPKPYVTHYERLMLPWTTGSDEILVTMLSRRLASESEDEKYSSFDSLPESTSAKSA
jgi:hypothetical protein